MGVFGQSFCRASIIFFKIFMLTSHGVIGKWWFNEVAYFLQCQVHILSIFKTIRQILQTQLFEVVIFADFSHNHIYLFIHFTLCNSHSIDKCGIIDLLCLYSIILFLKRIVVTLQLTEVIVDLAASLLKSLHLSLQQLFIDISLLYLKFQVSDLLFQVNYELLSFVRFFY